MNKLSSVNVSPSLSSLFLPPFFEEKGDKGGAGDVRDVRIHSLRPHPVLDLLMTPMYFRAKN